MLSILGQGRFAGTDGLLSDRLASAGPASDGLAPDGLAMDAPPMEGLRRTQAVDQSEYEYVLGRRQVASLSFVVLVLISVFAGISYLAGRAGVVRVNNTPMTIEGGPGHVASREVPPPPPMKTPPAAQTASLNSSMATPPPAPEAVAAASEGDLFADPVTGAIYIQTAATDKGVARVMAEGIRTHALPAIVAPGPNDKIFRVLVGPFPNMPAYQKAKDLLDGIGISAFARFQK